MSSARPHTVPAGAFVLLALLAGHVGADLLVLRDGVRVETRGAWQEKGRQVVFTDAQGKLCALRLTDVDLEASRAATTAAAVPAASTPPLTENRPVVLTLVDTDLGLGSDPDLDVDEPGPRQVTLYAADWCGVCRKTEQFFAQSGVAYFRRDVDADRSARLERDQRSGGRQVVPVVDWGGEIVVGFDGARFAKLALEDKQAAAERERRTAEREREEREREQREAEEKRIRAIVEAGRTADDTPDAEPPARDRQPSYGS